MVCYNRVLLTKFTAGQAGGSNMLSRRFSSTIMALGVVFLVFTLIGCSSGDPILPSNDTSTDLQSQPDTNRTVLGVYTLRIEDIEDSAGNVVDAKVELVPNRNLDFYHVDVAGWLNPPNCYTCLQIHPVASSWVNGGLIIQTTIIFSNPFNITGWDIRGIIFPGLDGSVPQADLMNFEGEPAHDGLDVWWHATQAYGDLEYNPYMTFNVGEEYAPFNGLASHGTTYWLWKAPDYPLVDMLYVVDASWSPGAHDPLTHNRPEAVDAYVPSVVGPIHPFGSDAYINVTLTDWQDNIDHVLLDLAELGGQGEVEMDYVSNPEPHKYIYEYYLFEDGGLETGVRRIRIKAYDQASTEYFVKDFPVYCWWDDQPPEYPAGVDSLIWDHISGPQYLWLFYYQGIDGSKPIEYIFYGGDYANITFADAAPALKVENDLTYTGYTDLGAVAAPDNVPRWYGIDLKDAQGIYDTYENICDYPATRYGAESTWTFIKDQPPNSDGIFGIALGDVDNVPGDEIVVGARNGKVYVLGGNGTGNQDTRIWEYTTGGEIQSTPALVDLNGDHQLDVVVASDDIIVYALDGAGDGMGGTTPLWTYPAGSGILMHGSPSIVEDYNGDTVPDVVIGTGDGTVLALSGADGSLIWDYHAGGGIAGTPAVADLNGDTIWDVVVGSYDTQIHAINGANGNELWTYYVGPGMYNIDCSPVLVDVNNDQVPDCIVGFRDNVGETKSAIVALDGTNGENELWYSGEIWGNARRTPTPIPDINGDMVPDFIVTAYLTEVQSVYCLSGADGSILYTRLYGIAADTVTNYSSPIIGDFTGDGHLNILYGRKNGFADLLNAGDLNHPSPYLGGWGGWLLFSMQISGADKKELYATPAMGDVDNDGEWELIACDMRGNTYKIDMNAPVPTDIEMRGWTQHQGNCWNTGTPYFEPPQ